MSQLALERKTGVVAVATASRTGGPLAQDATGRLERLPLFTQLGVSAALEVVSSAPPRDGALTAILVATSYGPVESMREFVAGLRTRGHARANPFLFPNVLYNAVAGEVAIRCGIRGPNVTLTGREHCGAGALETALLLLDSGRAKRVLVLSVEDGGGMLQRSYARARRRGFGNLPAVSRLRPMAEDVAVALLLDSEAAGELSISRARTGYARDAHAFERFQCRTREGLDVDWVLRLEGEEPPSLGRLLSAALELGPGCSLVSHWGEAGECGAVVLEI